MAFVFLLHELDCVLIARTGKKSFLVHELDENFIPTLYDKYYVMLIKKNYTKLYGKIIFFYCTNRMT